MDQIFHILHWENAKNDKYQYTSHSPIELAIPAP